MKKAVYENMKKAVYDCFAVLHFWINCKMKNEVFQTIWSRLSLVKI